MIDDQAAISADRRYTFLRISYEGFAESGEQRLGREISYEWVGGARVDDIVVSNINAVQGAICVMPSDLTGALVTPEFTVLRIKESQRNVIDPMYLWSVLRAPAVRAEWLSHSTGVGRHRVDWDLLSRQKVPLLPMPKQLEIGNLHRKAYELARESAAIASRATSQLDALDLYGELAQDKLARAKPPK